MANITTTTNINNNKTTELFDWFVNNKNVRGSKVNDGGLWQHNSAKPKYFTPATRVIELEDGTRYIIKKETMSKALGLDKVSESVLRSLPGRE
jgi:hypothetical protein